MAIKAVECKDESNLAQKIFGHREYVCKETHDDGRVTQRIHTGAKGRIKDQIKSYYGSDVEYTGLK